MESLHVKLGFTGKLVVESVGKSGGLCLFWSGGILVDLLRFSRYHIDVKVLSHVSLVWCLTGFYGNSVLEQHCHSWTLLRCLRKMSQQPWLCVGDFNEVFVDDEKQGGLVKPWKLLEDFRNALDSCELDDMGFRGSAFTWSNRRSGVDLIHE